MEGKNENTNFTDNNQCINYYNGGLKNFCRNIRNGIY